MGPGLANEGCDHEKHDQEYLETSWGEEARRCMGCGETQLRYADGLGG